MENNQRKDQNDVIKKQANDLEKTIKEKTKELEVIQDSCNHPKESIKLKDMNPNGSSDIRKYCDLCGHLIGYPSKIEMEDWIK